MSDPRLISPMLDNFVMGEPISEHNGVRCCPAMRRDSDEKYIVKIISIPASQDQLDALLLAGAYKDSGEALGYFQSLSEEVLRDLQSLQKLAKLEGFLPYDSYQVVPMEGATGFEIYLLAPYRQSLRRYLRKNTMTHLGAVNLGLDMCGAMAVCRRAGYLYVDLRPSNIFLSEKQEYRVGDLGFVRLSDLKYASLPDRYRSCYTAPEVTDAMSSLNTTMDIYAIGLILYQVFNGGTLPFDGQAPDEPLPPPMYADYEMAEIIQKACAPDPADRWQDPLEMGQAIVAYMQRNGANDTPIAPPAAAVDTEPPEQAANAESEAPGDAENDELAFLKDMVSDETAPDGDTLTDAAYDRLTDDASEILNQADDLIAHETPAPVVQPEAIDVPMPELIPVKPPEPEAASSQMPDEQPDSAADSETDGEQESAPKQKPPRRKRRRKFPVRAFLRTVIVLLVLTLLGMGGYLFYTHYYLVPVSAFTVSGEDNALTVRVETKADEKLLTVSCQDMHGNPRTAPVTNGTATFTDLTPNTQYQLTLSVEGFHKLTGELSASYNTPAQTNIIQFTATAGTEDGVVILNFTVDGKDPETWRVVCSADGEEERTETFTGHMVTLRDLTVGKAYTFRLTSDTPLYLLGQSELTYDVKPAVYAQNLTTISCADEALTVAWDAPEGAEGITWQARCYNTDGYDETVSVTGQQATFTGVDFTKEHTVEVTASGMTAGTHLYVSANPVTVQNFTSDVSDPNRIKLSWNYSGIAPDGGWLLLYTVNGGTDQQVITCESGYAEIFPALPGSRYDFTIQSASGTAVFNNVYTVQVADAPAYDAYGLTADDLTYSMCRTPDTDDWGYWDIPYSDYTSEFTAGSRAGLIVTTSWIPFTDWEPVVTLLLIRDANGAIVNAYTDTRPFDDMWTDGVCINRIPAVPDTPGDYSLSVYFDGAYAGGFDFTVVAAS